MSISCQPYEQSIYELFLPSHIIFLKVCMSIDKTNLFIVSFIRLLFYIIIYYAINDVVKTNKYVNIFFMSMIIINIIYIGIVVAKDPILSINKKQSVLEIT